MLILNTAGLQIQQNKGNIFYLLSPHWGAVGYFFFSYLLHFLVFFYIFVSK